VSNYRLDERSSIRGRGERTFPLASVSKSSSEAHPASYPMSNRGPFPDVKSGRSVTLITHPHLMPRSRMSRSYIYFLPWRLHGDSGTALLLLYYTHTHTHTHTHTYIYMCVCVCVCVCVHYTTKFKSALFTR
jgi:hypothetical protein